MLVNNCPIWLSSFYLRKVKDDLDKSFKIEKSFFFWKNSYERTEGVTCPIDFFISEFKSLPSAKSLLEKIRIPNVDKNNSFLLDERTFKLFFKSWYPDFTDNTYSLQVLFPLIIIYNLKKEMIQLLFKSECKRNGSNDVIQKYSPKIQTKIQLYRKNLVEREKLKNQQKKSLQKNIINVNKKFSPKNLKKIKKIKKKYLKNK